MHSIATCNSTRCTRYQQNPRSILAACIVSLLLCSASASPALRDPEPGVSQSEVPSWIRSLASSWPRFRRVPRCNEDCQVRRLELQNGTSNVTGTADAVTEEEGGDALINAIMGTFTLMGGTQIQPIILIVNGFIAAEVGKAWNAMLDDFNPDKIIACFLRAMSGFSVGTVGIQNMQFQSALQGGVLISSAFSITVREPLEKVIKENTDGELKKWLLLAVDTVVTGAGSTISMILKALFKVCNSAYLSATMVVGGWITIVEDSTQQAVPEFVEIIATVVVMLFCLWWHSLMLAKNRVSAWQRVSGKKKMPTFEVDGPMKRLKELMEKLAVPIDILNRCVQGFSMALGTSFNLKGQPMTTNQIMQLTCEKLGLPPPKAIIAKFVVTYSSKTMVNSALKQSTEKLPPKKRSQIVELTGLVCNSLDVAAMRRVIYEVQDGSGDFTVILDELFDDVMLAVTQSKRGALGKMAPEELRIMWESSKEGIKEKIAAKLKGYVTKGVITLSGIKDKGQQDYIVGLFENLGLQEMTTIMKLAKSGRFSLEDLQMLAQVKAEELEAKARAAAQKAKMQAEQKANEKVKEGREALDTEASKIQAQGGALDVEAVKVAVPQVQSSGYHAAAVPDSAIAQAALEKSFEKAPGQLAEALCDVVDLKAAMRKIPALGGLLNRFEATVRNTLKAILTPIPVVGPQLITIASKAMTMGKKMLISKSMGFLIKKNKIPLAQVAETVKKFAEMDEYIDDMLEQIINPEVAIAAAKAAAIGAAGNAAGAGGGHAAGAAADQKIPKIPEPKGVPGLIMEQINKYGPSACRDMLVHALVELFEIDLKSAKKFVKQLNPKDLMGLGQQVMTGGFAFEKCTELVKNKVEIITFLVPVIYLADGLGEDEMSFAFGGMGTPPTVIGVNEDWVMEVIDETAHAGKSDPPEKGDRLVAVGSIQAKEMTKDLFEATLESVCTQAKSNAPPNGDPPPIKLVFARGLDVDFGERFRKVLPSVLRKFIGIPFEEGQQFARNLDMNTMQKVVYLLLTGGVKKFDDLATNLGVEVNFEQSLKADLPLKLTRKFGFSMAGAEKFCEALDPAAGAGLNALIVRFKQMFGFGDLELMAAILCFQDINMLDKLHKMRYNPRVDLNKLLKEDPLITGKPTNLTVTEKGKCELWQSGAPLGPIHRDTLEIVHAIWREHIDLHADEDTGPIHGVAPWSSPDAVNALQEARTEPQEKIVAKEFFKWPEHVITKAQLGEGDKKVAFELFFHAVAEARRDVWARFENKILHEANHCLGPGSGDQAESAGQEEAKISVEIADHDEVRKDIRDWFKTFLSSLPPKGPKRTAPLLQIHKAILERDTFRLTKMATKYGIAKPCPEAGLQAQLKRDLSSLPIDITTKANELAAFVAESKNPLTGHLAGKKKVAPKTTGAPGMMTEARHSAPLPEFAKCTRCTPDLDLEARHDPPPPEFAECAPRCELDFKSPAPPLVQKHPVACHGAEAKTVAGPAKMKDLFILAQKGDFELLSKFSATEAPGGSKAVAQTMRKQFEKLLVKGFGAREKDAAKAVQLFVPAIHTTTSATKLKNDKPTADDPMPDLPEKRDGSAIKSGKAVSVVETFDKYVCVARPERGWLLASEVVLMPETKCEDQEARMLDKVSLYTRLIKQYKVEELQEVSDELDMGIDFAKMARERILDAIKKKSQDYQTKCITRALKQLDSNGLKQCLNALDRLEINFVIESLGLPPPQKAKPKAKPPPPAPSGPPPWEKQISKLLEQVQSKDDLIAAHRNEIAEKDLLLISMDKEMNELKKQVSELSLKMVRPEVPEMKQPKVSQLSLKMVQPVTKFDGRWIGSPSKKRKATISGTSLIWPSGEETQFHVCEDSDDKIILPFGNLQYEATLDEHQRLHWSDGEVWILRGHDEVVDPMEEFGGSPGIPLNPPPEGKCHSAIFGCGAPLSGQNACGASL